MKRNGDFTTAPKNSCGCKHCAMSEMRRVSTSDFSYYIKRDEALYNQKCSEKNARTEQLENIGQSKKYVVNNGKLTGANLVVQKSAEPIFALTVVRRG